jgi:hypothetical protein
MKRVTVAALPATLACLWPCTGSAQSSTTAAIVDVTVRHRVAVVGAKFELYTQSLEKILGRFAAEALRDVADKPQLAKQRLEARQEQKD